MKGEKKTHEKMVREKMITEKLMHEKMSVRMGRANKCVRAGARGRER